MASTMQDIARECGLSMMTVSRALQGHPRVSASTREKVLKAAEHLDYEINVLAQNFARKRSGFIGVATPFEGLVGSNYFGELIRGVQKVLEGTARNFALFDTLSASFNDGRKLEKLWRNRTVEGLLVVAPNIKDKYLDTFSDLDMPLVVVGKRVANARICCVACDDARGVELACEHLYALGHRRLAFIGGPIGFSVAQTRERAYLQFCAAKHLKMPAGYLQRGDYSSQSGRLAGLALLQLEQPPSAIIAANDVMAMAAVESARQLGMDVPGQVSIAGFDDVPMAADLFPPLTTVHQPVAEMAEQSARLLVEWIETGKRATGLMTMPTALKVRASTGAAS